MKTSIADIFKLSVVHVDCLQLVKSLKMNDNFDPRNMIYFNKAVFMSRMDYMTMCCHKKVEKSFMVFYVMQLKNQGVKF